MFSPEQLCMPLEQEFRPLSSLFQTDSSLIAPTILQLLFFLLLLVLLHLSVPDFLLLFLPPLFFLSSLSLLPLPLFFPAFSSLSLSFATFLFFSFSSNSFLLLRDENETTPAPRRTKTWPSSSSSSSSKSSPTHACCCVGRRAGISIMHNSFVFLFLQ